MKVSVTDSGVCRKTMTIEIPAEAISAEKAETLKIYAKNVNIPGFRKGKVPAQVVEKKYRKEVLQDVQERLVPKFYREALGETALKVVNVIDVTEVKMEDNVPLVFDVIVDVEPEFKLPKYEGIVVKDETEPVTDVMVQEQIDVMRQQYSEYKEVEDQAVKKGDMAQLKYTATVDGKPMIEVVPTAKGIDEGDGYWISADDYAFLPGMGEAIVGLNIGDTKEVDVEFPADFAVKELGGIKAFYRIEVTAVRVRVLSEIDEVFLKRFRVESVEELQARIREQMEEAAEQRSKNIKYEQIIKFLIEKTKLDLPESVLQQQVRSVMYDLARQRIMMGQTQEQVSEQQEEIMKEAQARAVENVKLRYIGLAIATEQKFVASDVEINEEISNMAIQERKNARTLRKEMEENDTLASVADQIRFNKALDYMLTNAKVK